MHSCSHPECYGRSGFCDCNGNYEWDVGEPSYNCKQTERYGRCGRAFDTRMPGYGGPQDKGVYTEVDRNVLCNAECGNFNCQYILYEQAGCQNSSLLDNFILYGATKYGDFPVQYLPNDQGKCSDVADGKKCPGMPLYWNSYPQDCENDNTGPWHFKSIKINKPSCSVQLFENLNQAGKGVTFTYNGSNQPDGSYCVDITGLKSTRSGFSSEQCSQKQCTKLIPKGTWDPTKQSLAGRGVLWNDCVTFREAYGETCQNYPGMKPGDVCQLWDGAFEVNCPESGTCDRSTKTGEILKNSTVEAGLESGSIKSFPCVIVDTCTPPHS